jgi:transcriptional regulator MraZ
VTVFLGTHTPRLDEKGRIFLPAKFRDELAEGLVVTRGQERCLYVWPAAEFRAFTASLQQDAVRNRQNRGFMRMLAAGASAENADRQGRVTLPPLLRTYAGLDRDCVVIGAYNRVEIWDAEAWQRYTDEQEDAFANWSEEVLTTPDDTD